MPILRRHLFVLHRHGENAGLSAATVHAVDGPVCSERAAPPGRPAPDIRECCAPLGLYEIRSCLRKSAIWLAPPKAGWAPPMSRWATL